MEEKQDQQTDRIKKPPAGLAVLALYVPYAIVVWPGADVVAMHVAIFLVTAYALGLIGGHRETRMDDAQGFHWGPTLIVAFFVVLVLFDAVLVVVATRGLPEPVARVLLPQAGKSREITSAFPGGEVGLHRPVLAEPGSEGSGVYACYRGNPLPYEVRGERLLCPPVARLVHLVHDEAVCKEPA